MICVATNPQSVYHLTDICSFSFCVIYTWNNYTETKLWLTYVICSLNMVVQLNLLVITALMSIYLWKLFFLLWYNCWNVCMPHSISTSCSWILVHCMFVLFGLPFQVFFFFVIKCRNFACGYKLCYRMWQFHLQTSWPRTAGLM